MSEVVDSIAKLATTLGSLLGGPYIPAALEIGKDVLKLIDQTKAVVGEKDAARLEAIRDELEPKVMAHSDQTENMLRGQ